MTVRVYVAGSARLLGALKADGRLPGPLEACGVTADVRAALDGLDQEELEYAAFAEAAQRSLRLLEGGPMRRVVIAADVVDAAPGEGFGGLVLAGGLELAQVAAVHADATDAARAVAEARTGGPGAMDAIDDHDLLWFATQEIDDLLADLAAGGPSGPAV